MCESRLMLMRQIVLVVSVVLLAGCTDSPATTPVTPTEELRILTGLRGTSLDGPECPTPTEDQGAVAQPTPDTEIPHPTSLTLCTSGRRTYEITDDDPMFGRVLSGLSTPDPSDPPSGCDDYADSPVTLVAVTGEGYFLVHIPEDGCGHYNSQVKTTLYAATASTPALASGRVTIQMNHCFVEPVTFDGEQWNVPFEQQFGWGGLQPKRWQGVGVMMRLGEQKARFSDKGGATIVFRPVDHPSVREVEKTGCD